MSQLDQLIYSRRSIRKYKPAPPPVEWIKPMIMCAIQAPSPSNTQPVRFIKISSDSKKYYIYEAITKAKDHLIARHQLLDISKKVKNLINTYYRFSSFIIDAPWLFAVGVENQANESFHNRLFNNGLANQKMANDPNMDICVGLSVNSFLIKATELGLGTCVLTAPLVFAPDIKKIPEWAHIDIKCLITAGFPDETPTAPPKKNFSDVFFEI